MDIAAQILLQKTQNIHELILMQHYADTLSALVKVYSL